MKPFQSQMNTGDGVYVCTIAVLYSTGHWIGATILLILFLLVKLEILE